MKTIIDTARNAEQFSTLLNALKAASLTETLRGKGPFTFFAPTDEAFKRLPAGSLNVLLKDPGKLRTILEYHVVSGVIASRDLQGGEVKTVGGTSLRVESMDSGNLTVDDAKVVEADIAALNGVIHAIDALLMPKGTMLAAVA